MQPNVPERPRAPRRLRRRVIAVGAWVFIIALALSLIIPAFLYVMEVSYTGQCKHRLKVITRAMTPDVYGPHDVGDAWPEGLAWDDAEQAYVAPIPEDNIRRSRMAFWRLAADPKYEQISGGIMQTRTFLCPTAARRTGQMRAAERTTDGRENRDFRDPRRELSYSMFNQGLDGIIPKFGMQPYLVVMADRSPQDDGYALGANSANHRWGNENTGQNICYASGTIEWVDSTAVGIDEDEIYARGKDAATRITKTTTPVDINDTILMPVAE